MRIFTLLSFSVIFNFILVGDFIAQAEGKKADGLEWYVDIMKANEVSIKTNRPIFAFFTGSDWCGWCKKLEADVFSKREFIDWASKNVILLELDFPRGKQLAPELVQQNNSLQQTFQVAGYPTIWIFNMVKNETVGNYNINAIGSLGYPAGAERGKEQVKFLKEADKIMNNNKK